MQANAYNGYGGAQVDKKKPNLGLTVPHSHMTIVEFIIGFNQRLCLIDNCELQSVEPTIEYTYIPVVHTTRSLSKYF